MVQYTRFPNGKKQDKRQGTGAGQLGYSRASNRSDSREAPVSKTAPDSGTPARNPEREGQVPLGTPAGKYKNTPLLVFLISLLIPLQFYAGPLLLSPYRLFLLVMIIPLIFKWISGGAGKIYGLDFVFLAFVLWINVTLLVVHGFEFIELMAITSVETFGGFLVGRVLVRNPKDFDILLRVLTISMFLFLPAAILESTTGIRVFAKLADIIGNTHPWVHAGGRYEQRLGMYRSQMVFEHPILFGVFVATAFGLLYYRTRPQGGIYGYKRAWVPTLATFFSLSSGAFLATFAQMGLVFWDKVMGKVKNHWKILIGLVALAYVVVDLISNRTPFEVFISYAAFSAHNGYMRINIFTFGMDNVWANPVFGLGMNNWVRPRWMHASSVDNFWLLMAMRYGFPGFIFIAWYYIGTLVRLAKLPLRNATVSNMRLGLVVTMTGLLFSLMTVHIWGAIYVYFCFLLGAGVWMRGYAEDQDDAEEEEPAEPTGRAVQKRGR